MNFHWYRPAVQMSAETSQQHYRGTAKMKIIQLTIDILNEVSLANIHINCSEWKSGLK